MESCKPKTCSELDRMEKVDLQPTISSYYYISPLAFVILQICKGKMHRLIFNVEVFFFCSLPNNFLLYWMCFVKLS